MGGRRRRQALHSAPGWYCHRESNLDLQSVLNVFMYGYQIEFAGVDSYAMLGNSEFMCFHCFAFLILFRFHFCFSVVACVVAFALRSAFCVRFSFSCWSLLVSFAKTKSGSTPDSTNYRSTRRNK